MISDVPPISVEGPADSPGSTPIIGQSPPGGPGGSVWFGATSIDSSVLFAAKSIDSSVLFAGKAIDSSVSFLHTSITDSSVSFFTQMHY